MCNYKTKVSDWFCEGDVWKEICERFEPLREDGLLELDKNEIVITKAGRAYLRNICLMFDARYWKKIPSQQVFSSTA